MGLSLDEARCARLSARRTACTQALDGIFVHHRDSPRVLQSYTARSCRLANRKRFVIGAPPLSGAHTLRCHCLLIVRRTVRGAGGTRPESTASGPSRPSLDRCACQGRHPPILAHVQQYLERSSGAPRACSAAAAARGALSSSSSCRDAMCAATDDNVHTRHRVC